MQYLECRGRVGVGQNHGPCPCQAGRHECFLATGIGVHHGIAGGGGLADAFGVEVERHVLDALSGQHFRQRLTIASIAADDHVPVGLDGARGQQGELQGLGHPLFTGEAHRQLVAVGDQERRRKHRQQHRREDRVHEMRIDQLQSSGLRQQHKAEFARLRQSETGTYRGTRRAFEKPRKTRDDREFRGHRHQGEKQYQSRLRKHRTDVKQHADGNKKQPEQDIAKRFYVLLDLMTVFRFRDQHAGYKGAKGKRQAGMLGDIGQPKGHQQQIEYEQFGRSAACHHGKPGMDHLAPCEQQDSQDHRRLRKRQAQRIRDVLRIARQCRHHDQERYDREILKQQHADHVAPVRGLKLAAFSEELDQDGGRRHGQRAAQRHARLPAHAGQECGGDAKNGGDSDLGQTKAEDHAAHRHQLGQVELQANREHQKNHPELRQIARVRRVRDEAQGVRSDDDSCQQIAEHRRQVELARKGHDTHRRGEENQDDFEGAKH